MIAGDGPDRDALEAAARRGPAVTSGFTGWVDQDAATAWLAHAAMLIFPSRGPESLSRVLIEASALGVPIAAMNTGGTRDIVDARRDRPALRHAGGLAGDVRRLRADDELRQRLGAAAMARADERFDAAAVVRAIERLYRELHWEPLVVSRPIRVAIVARSVFPLHGHGGLERHVYDLAAVPGRRAASGSR